MVKLFLVVFLTEKGLDCDCCVSVLRITANVYAENKTQAQELIKGSHSNAQIESLTDKGEATTGNNIGIMAFPADEVFRGCYRDSPLYVP